MDAQTINPEDRGARPKAAKRVRFTPAVIEMRAPKVGRIERRDDLSPLWLRITQTGDRTFAVRARIKGQDQPIRVTFPERAHVSNLEAARTWAIKIDAQCRLGNDPREEQRVAKIAQAAEREHVARANFERVAQDFLDTNGITKKNGRAWKPRTKLEYERAINNTLAPKWKGRIIHTITRDEIADFLAEVAERTPVAANRIHAVLSALMSWYQTQRGSRFTSPIVKGMAPTEETARDRILSDDELRIVWQVAGKTGTFGGMVKTLLLTAARKGEVASMRHSQIGSDGIWALSGELTKNSSPLFLPLSKPTLAVIAAEDRTDKQDIVFSHDGTCEFRNFGHNKARFDARVLRRLKAWARVNGKNPSEVQALPNWTLHDLRRTARSLMARAKVRPDHAERVLNHKIAGVEAVYDRHSYEDEKRDALERLAALIERIVNPPADNVVRLAS